MKIVFATNNKNKLREVSEILGDDFEILSLDEIGCHVDIPETGSTLEENARQKSFYIYEHYGVNCFSDDTGLEVDALGGEPGVYSARYAGEEKNSEKNIDKLLKSLDGIQNRSARFRTVVSLVIDGVESQFEGEVRGNIATERHGNGGFGYDSVFFPEGHERTFGELPAEVKNSMSHRARAIDKLASFLKGLKEG